MTIEKVPIDYDRLRNMVSGPILALTTPNRLIMELRLLVHEIRKL